ncbi:MAG: ubiquinol-cytochrome c reductase cytochrome b subunit [Candidatus Nanopelagicales bacterium]|nr:ubiquinol-cytochrome c reductase cytochrome b subunit [Candidatus Nanopelagicales bacterium]
MSAVMNAGGKGAGWLEDRLGNAPWLRRQINKVFPDHWSFMLGEIALYSFIVILLTGVYLTLWFNPSMTEVVYDGSYAPLKGVKMSESFASTLHISFDVRGGLLIRQIHHMAALFFVAAIALHLLRVFFTGAFRKPREMNWVIGCVLFVLAIAAGFSGYSLPDDLLSGTGLRITQGIIQATPVVGTWMSFLIFDGEFPGLAFLPRLYSVHILLIPGLILALVTAHLLMVWYQKHTQFPGPGRTNDNVVGYPFMPIYMAKAGGFFFVVFGTIVALSGLVQINPVWAYGPYMPDQVTAGSQPDWYVGFLDGALRLMPNWEISALGVTLSINVFFPAMILAPALLTVLALYPWIERFATRDNREHHLLDRPRNVPVRTAIGAATVAFYIVLMIGGGNDVIAYNFDLSINTMIRILQVSLFVVPVVTFIVTKRIALSLQRRDRDLLLHGRETGRILRLPSGEFLEIHEPVDEETRAKIMAKADIEPLALPEAVDEHGVANPEAKKGRRRAKVSGFFYKDNVPLPTEEELAAARHHLEHELDEAVEAGSKAAKEIAGQQSH